MKHWESYVLGAIGITIAVPSLAAQIIVIADDRPWTAALYSIGVVVGALLYRAGYQLRRRSNGEPSA